MEVQVTTTDCPDSIRPDRPRYVVVTPVRNEAAYVGRTIDSVAAQTLRPTRWVLVDDGSTDGTGEILEAASSRYPWMTVVRRPDRGFRKPGGGVVEAFYDGYAALDGVAWDFIVKLDGDLSFGPDYFEKCLARFADDPQLGIGGGTIYVTQNGRLTVDCPDDPPFHVRGATRIYRRACWEKVHPLVRAPGWDTVDEVRANLWGWRTRTFPDVQLVQQRETGGADGMWVTWFKNGLAGYVIGYHPAFVLARCVKYLWAKPRVLASAAMFAGYCSGYLKRQPHVADAPSVRYLRQQQVRYLTLRPGIYGRLWERARL
jgi:glycosyltransferase involved in cell wall biosynthesis